MHGLRHRLALLPVHRGLKGGIAHTGVENTGGSLPFRIVIRVQLTQITTGPLQVDMFGDRGGILGVGDHLHGFELGRHVDGHLE